MSKQRSSKKIQRGYVFSVYSPDLEDYPYFPFFGKSITDGINQYVRFLSGIENICSGPELHLIGYCDNYDGVYRNIQPALQPKRVDISDRFYGKLYALACYYVYKIERYLEKLMLFYK